MIGHLKEHGIDATEGKADSKTTTTKTTVARLLREGESIDDHFEQLNKLDQAGAEYELALWIAQAFKPISSVEHETFRSFISRICPKFNLPQPATLRSQILSIAQHLRSEVCVAVAVVLRVSADEGLHERARRVCVFYYGWVE